LLIVVLSYYGRSLVAHSDGCSQYGFAGLG
jgi:hypothetical protein